MPRHDLILRNPLRLLGKTGDEILPAGGLGAILARSGVGKTALMVQLALNGLLNGSRVLHVSLSDPIGKVRLWYDEVLRDIAAEYERGALDDLWASMRPQRFIMSFTREGFSVPVLAERLEDLTEQQIFKPDIILLDGLPINDRTPVVLGEIKALASAQGANCWLTMRTHRDQPVGDDGFPLVPTGLAGYCDVALQLDPGDGQVVGGGEQSVAVRVLKGDVPPGEQQQLYLDPTTMLVRVAAIF